MREPVLFPKLTLFYRLKESKDFLDKSRNLKGDAKDYYQQMAEITVGEVKSILSKGKTTPKRKIKVENIDQEMKELEIQLAQEGERIWLM